MLWHITRRKVLDILVMYHFYSLSLKVLKCLDLFNYVVLFVKSEE